MSGWEDRDDSCAAQVYTDLDTDGIGADQLLVHLIVGIGGISPVFILDEGVTRIVGIRFGLGRGGRGVDRASRRIVGRIGRASVEYTIFLRSSLGILRGGYVAADEATEPLELVGEVPGPDFRSETVHWTA